MPSIKARRQELGLTADEAARRAGCTVSMWYKVESGARRPSIALAVRMAAALAWDLATFLTALGIDDQTAARSA